MLRALLSYYLFTCGLTIIASDIETEAVKFYESGKNKYLSYKYGEASSDFENALSLFESNPGKYAIALLNTRAFLVTTYWNEGHGRKAQSLAKLCYDQLTIFTDNENPDLIDAYLLLAEFYVQMDFSYEVNNFLLEKAGRIISQVHQGDLRKSGIFYCIKGYSDYSKNDYENAYYYLRRSIEILKKFPDHIRYENLSHVYLTYSMIQNKEVKEAMNYANNILKRRDLAPEARLNLINAMAMGYVNLKDTLKVLEYCKIIFKAASANNTGTNILMTSRAYSYIADVKKNKDEKIFYLKKALVYAQKLYDRGKEVIYLNIVIGNLYNSKKEHLIALRHVQNALIAASVDFNDTSILSTPPVEKLINCDNIIYILFTKGTILPSINSNDKFYTKLALQCFEMAYSMLDKQLRLIDIENSVLNMIDYRQHLLGYVVTHANYIYRYTGEEEYARKAFHYAEKEKAQVLKMYTGKAEVLKKCGVPDSLITRSEQLGKEILQTENMIALMQEQGNDISELTKKLTYLSDQCEFLNYEIVRDYPLYDKAGYPSVPEIEEIQSVLQPDQALIEYEMISSQIITFVITKKGFYQHYQTINYADTRSHLENLRQMVSSAPLADYSDSTFKSFVSSSAFLYDLLIRPVYSKIKGKRLIIIPQGEMTAIPFEALISEDYKGRSDYSKLNWLIREFPVMYAFSANYLLDKNGAEFGKGMAAFMPVYNNPADNLSYLQGAENEVQYLRRKLGFKVFSRRRSDEAYFRNSAPRFRIIHIAAHTITNDARPDLSGFIFNKPEDNSDDGKLYSFEIKQLRLKAQLVVLNGCNTGYGTLKKGEGMVSLARSFFFTGIRTVAYTLWPVADRTAQELVTRFYNEIYNHQPPDIALMRSKLAFIQTADPVKAHPFYWAGFIVSGKSQIIPCKRNYIKPAAIILLILAIIAAYLTLRDYQRRREERISSDC